MKLPVAARRLRAVVLTAVVLAAALAISLVLQRLMRADAAIPMLLVLAVWRLPVAAQAETTDFAALIDGELSRLDLSGWQQCRRSRVPLLSCFQKYILLHLYRPCRLCAPGVHMYS